MSDDSQQKEKWELLSAALARDLEIARKKTNQLEAEIKQYEKMKPQVEAFNLERTKVMKNKVGSIENFLKTLPSVFEKDQGKTPFIDNLSCVVNNFVDGLKQKAEDEYINLNNKEDETISVLAACAASAQIKSSDLQQFLLICL